ncbi:MAG: thermonuclease family protein [Thermotogae bacterium]|nr:thermonuclease family protein [Thermotogota bacterium]MCP5465178.1 thermonuclease family protein [Thermotogota bacterium]
MKKLSFLLIIISFALLFVSCSKTQIPQTINDFNQYYVIKVTDGDTIKVSENGETNSMRFIGVDTPELHSGDKPEGELGHEAYYFTGNAIIKKSKYFVYVQFDGDKYDNYDRLLGYIYYKDENGNLKLLNAELLEKGLGRPLFYDDTSAKKDIFTEAYKKAYNDRAGIFAYYDDPARIKKDSELEDSDIGKIRWVEFYAENVRKDGKFYKIYSDTGKFYISIRQEEYNAFFETLNPFDLKDRKIRIYGEVWKDSQYVYEILARAEFEFKIIE